MTARLGSAFGDHETFERQRRAIRHALTYDGKGTWYGRLPRRLDDDLQAWQAVFDAAEAGASVIVGRRQDLP